ncbi:MAG: hypothetical protein Q9218_002223, partial [Villophora microphyllina]
MPPSIGDECQPPSAILVIGAGVFGLSTTHSLLCSPLYARTHITLVDPNIPDSSSQTSSDDHTYIPNPHAASIDSSRIIRPDYANPTYSGLAAEAQGLWRKGYGGEDVYHESGLVVVAGKEGSQYVDAACRNVENTNSNDNGNWKKVERLNSAEEIRVAAGLGRSSPRHAKEVESEQLGSTGYINHTSGWANAEGAIRTVMQRISSHGPSRVTFNRAKVKNLLFHQDQTNSNNDKGKPTVSGVVLTDNSILTADLTIIATGAWTGSLLDLRGRARATAQV